MRTLQRIASLLLPKRFYCEDGLISAHQHAFVNEPRFKEAYDYAVRVSGTDPQNRWRILIALWCVRQSMILPGDLIELGVNHGFTSGAIMHYFRPIMRRFWLIDCWNKPGYNNDVTKIEARFSCQQIIVGELPDALWRIGSSKLAFIHFDLNDGRAEVESFLRLRDSMLKGTVILLDDYNYAGFEDTKKEWDTLGLNIMPLPTGQGLIII